MILPLLPCPFCGAKPDVGHDPHPEGLTWIGCSSCLPSPGLCEPREDAVTHWNTRASNPHEAVFAVEVPDDPA